MLSFFGQQIAMSRPGLTHHIFPIVNRQDNVTWLEISFFKQNLFIDLIDGREWILHTTKKRLSMPWDSACPPFDNIVLHNFVDVLWQCHTCNNHSGKGTLTLSASFT